MVRSIGAYEFDRPRTRGSKVISVTSGNAYILSTTSVMRVELQLEVPVSSKKRRILPKHLLDYEVFSENFRSEESETELHMLEKFHAARILSKNADVDAYVDAVLCDPDRHSRRITVDIVGVHEDGLTAIFCETKPPNEDLIKDLEMVDESQNSKAVVVYPFKINSDTIEAKFHSAVNTGKFVIEHLNWRDKGLERAFRDVLELMDVLTNETRVRMLLPLLEHPQGKKHFREDINPKLIYENVPLLRTHKLIDELSDDLYGLTPIGKMILCEYLSFVEKVSQLLENDKR